MRRWFLPTWAVDTSTVTPQFEVDFIRIDAYAFSAKMPSCVSHIDARGPRYPIEYPGPHSVKSLPYGNILGGHPARGFCPVPGCLPCGEDRGPKLGWETAGLPLFLRHGQCGGNGVLRL